jgi:hypothetical protein
MIRVGSIEVNDINLFLTQGLRGPYFVQVVRDQLDQLHADATAGARVMALCLHPFAAGQPFRHRYLDDALDLVANHPDVWLTTTDEIAEHYARNAGGIA